MNWLSDKKVERLREEVELPDLEHTKYRLIRKLGSGGMGTVYLAQDTDLGRKVAVKVMNVADSTGALATRMTREARIVALLEHPGIVPIHDVGRLDDGRVFYAMKLVQGSRLDEHARGASSLSDLLRIFQKVCEAVAFAHASDVIHRDLKPENIMVGPFGEVLVIDWGVAKVLLGGQTRSNSAPAPVRELGAAHDVESITTLPLAPAGQLGETSGGTVIGTPAYMSPEQARGETESLDQRSDVYALGAILYYILTGRAPAATGRSPRPRQIDTRIPRAIEAVCLKAMSERREDRYGTAEEIAADVVKFLDGLPVSAYRESVIEKAGRWISRNRYIVVLVLAYLVMRAVVFFFVGR
ncbi:MAG TPA: serine/threonine-protein kinase [Blastocatellia bacterium]|nr:serine/threonine-protein kinase [Blastocatellia bacterium]